MTCHSRLNDNPEMIRETLVALLDGFKHEIEKPDLREKVIALIPAFHKLRRLGCSLLPADAGASARDRVLAYFRRYPHTLINGDELMVVSGIAEWARRLRELRVQYGWAIFSGLTFRQMAEDADAAGDTEASMDWRATLGVNPAELSPDQYVLVREEADRLTAHRWHVLNGIRRNGKSVKDKILDYFLQNIGDEITGEELKYLAKDRNEWTRRVRELRTEEGWPIVTKNSGRDDLAIGVYVFEENRQAYQHDRRISDPVRVAVLKRDGFQCVRCGWNRSMLSRDDPRRMLELHHVQPHNNQGANVPDNLITLCNVDHDEAHRLLTKNSQKTTQG